MFRQVFKADLSNMTQKTASPPEKMSW
ncbi:hypothetical protein CGRA01v4_14930 [Colletotrichum graminicola]|nr:hypothetical protein CGRA01v4_14930 [Colletotrichum graminicola]